MAYDDLFGLMQPQADDYAHGQIDRKINENSLLNILTGYQTAADIPPLSTTGKITPENLSDLWASLNEPRYGENVEAPGLGMLELATGPVTGKAGLLKNILSSIKTGGKSLMPWKAPSKAAKVGLSRAGRTIEKTVAKAKGVPLAGKRGDMMEKAQRFLIPSARADKVYVPGHAYYTSGKFKGGFAKHLEFAPKTFKSEKTLNTAIKNIQSRISKGKDKIRKFTDRGEKELAGAWTQDLYVHQQKFDALVAFKRAPEKELVEKLHKFMESRPSGDVSWYSMGQRIYEDSFGYTYSKGFTKMPSSWK